MEYDKKRCSVVIDLETFRNNCRLVKSCLPAGCRLMAVLKGNAYGHGAVMLAKQLEGENGDWIAVASLGEAMELREAGIRREILILGYTDPGEAKLLADRQITQSVISWQYGMELAKEARRAGVTVSCHLAVDTGMSRIGLLAYGTAREESIAQAESLYRNDSLHFTGIFTHFSSAYGMTPEDRAYTAMQYDRFYRFCEDLKALGIDVGLRHCNNSPSIINYPEYALDMCRGGTLLFGFMDQASMSRPVNLQTVMRFQTIVTMVKELEEGTAISYSRTAVTSRKTKIAVLGVGWYDGYPRLLGNRGTVLIRGKEFPIIGKVCMDLCMADITGDDTIREGDEVVLLGRQMDREISCRQLYEPLGVGPGSIGGGISRRVPRIYIHETENGR